MVDDAIKHDNDFQRIKNLFKGTDRATANAILRTVDPEKRTELQQRALIQAREPNSSTASVAAWTTFMELFRKGPTVWSSPKQESRAPTLGHSESAPRRRKLLRARDLEYDGTSLVTSYINRLKWLAESYSDDAVLDELPVALKGDAREWFDSLFPDTKFRMNESLDEWFRQLRSRFQINASVALQQADTLRHSFDNEETLTVGQYMTQKQSLYLEAGEQNEDIIIRRIYNGLDPTLAMAVILRPRMTLNSFYKAVHAADCEQFKQMLQY